ncbi:uncharacterized protein LOC130189093 [Pseudoliparis swirei]|uniref:uncharacterized protein LOC130189093 n=1 Tax=Pseudoliparis swirei TaxID=2059687 RepID=UPI0024BD9CC9|nr:uncharacterized protein LOC130189093 [Pseudoliparis swirei]XP_056263741.1 uncharacterized protein LOC130189093 [Pseudoliparis swirei]
MECTDDYIWRQRIHHGVRYQKSAVPFPESVAVGLEFNAALERAEPLAPGLLTNGVMLELCYFARTVNRSESYFFFEMLEFNFELGVAADDERQRYDYVTRVHNKVKLLRENIRMKPRRWRETFLFPERAAGRPQRYCPKRNTLADSSLLSAERAAASGGAALLMKKREGPRVKLIADAYPFCKALGVTLAVRTGGAGRARLAPGRATNAVMLEMLDFSRLLCGTHTGIVLDLVLHNFGLAMERAGFRLQVVKVTERRNTCLTAGDKEAFRKERFEVQTRKRKRRTYVQREPEGLVVAGKRRAAPDEDAIDVSYMCPVECEPETQSDSEAGREEGMEEEEQEEQEEEEEEQEEEEQEEEEQGEAAARPQSVSALFSEGGPVEAGVRAALWARRAARCRRILASGRGEDSFARCRERGLDFNVAAAGRRRLDRRLLTNGVLREVYQFSTAMAKSLRSFVFEILDNNFHLLLQGGPHRQNFLLYMSAREKLLRAAGRQDHAVLGRLFEFPEVYNMVDVTRDFQTGPEPPARSRDPYPFCGRMGLDLWAAARRPAGQKLDLTAVTAGAVLEVFSFARRLCGSARQTASDVLERNFHLDLRGGAAEASRAVGRWYRTQRTPVGGRAASPQTDRWLNAAVPLDAPPDPRPAPATEEELPVYRVCQQIGLDLDVGVRRAAKPKLALRALTRGALLEMHRYVRRRCNRYVPALYDILDYNFDLSARPGGKVEFAWAVATQVVAIAAKSGRPGAYLDRAVELPGAGGGVKDEPRDEVGGAELRDDDDDDVEFVRELKPVDIEVKID